MRMFGILVIAMVLPTSFAHAINKCDLNGRPFYQNAPCPAAADATTPRTRVLATEVLDAGVRQQASTGSLGRAADSRQLAMEKTALRLTR